MERGLELREQLARDAGDIANARHRQKNALGIEVEGHLEALGELLDRNHATAEAHVAEDHQ
jgi:hypothetical protein